MNTAAVLRAAAARVRQGWIQGGLSNSAGVCAVGAIAVAVGARFERDVLGRGLYALYDEAGSIAESEARKAIREALCLKTSPGECAIPVWNDAPGQTAENVAAGLEYAALIWEQEQAAKQPERELTAAGT